MTRDVPITTLGVLLLATLVVGLAGMGIALASIAHGDETDFTATWKLEDGGAGRVRVTEDDGAYTATFAEDGSDWERSGAAIKVDRFQLAGRLGDPVAAQAGADLPLVATTPAGTAFSLVSVNDDRLVVAVRPEGDDYWTDLGTYERGGLWSDPYRFAGFLVFVAFVVMAIVLIFEVPMGGRTAARERPARGKLALRAAAGVLVAVLLVALLAAQPWVARLTFIVLFAVWLGYMVKWLPGEVTGTGEFLTYVFSPARRRQHQADAAARHVQAGRGIDLERTLFGVKQEWSVAPSAPRPAEPGPGAPRPAEAPPDDEA